ncbi:jg3487 [Pararge aegeria aegeria]|uniref:Jg3487 protein n=1 Tax=Pararge aegeria aegeria TaxID=348720 RepID=A0A8S4R8M4_9NEOP|nr:jg3487 [Pararge aegeria aegeria]
MLSASYASAVFRPRRDADPYGSTSNQASGEVPISRSGVDRLTLLRCGAGGKCSGFHGLYFGPMLSTICLKRIPEYFGHIARTDGDNLDKHIVTGKVEGKRLRGRCPIRWSDQIRCSLDTNVYGDRKEWQTIVKKKVMDGGGHDPQT